MKTQKFLNFCLLGLAALLLVTAVFAFINGNIIYGICNILWMGCEIFFFSVNKENIEVLQKYERAHAFLSIMNETIEKNGAAIITEDKDGYWQIAGGIGVERGNKSCASENKDNMEFVHNAEGGKK